MLKAGLHGWYLDLPDIKADSKHKGVPEKELLANLCSETEAAARAQEENIEACLKQGRAHVINTIRLRDLKAPSFMDRDYDLRIVQMC